MVDGLLDQMPHVRLRLAIVFQWIINIIDYSATYNMHAMDRQNCSGPRGSCRLNYFGQIIYCYDVSSSSDKYW